MKKFSLQLVFLLSSNLLQASSVPYFYSSYNQQLQTINPAFYGMNANSLSQNNSIELACHSMYSKRFDYDNIWVYNMFRDYGFRRSRDEFRDNIHCQQMIINSRTQLSKHLFLGLGGSISIDFLNDHSEGKGLNYGASLIFKTNGGAYFSTGLNAKIDFFKHRYPVDEGQFFESRNRAHNLDVGLAYMSAGKHLQIGLGIFNLNNQIVEAFNPSEPMNIGFGRGYIMTYYRSLALNIVKSGKLNKSGTLRLKTTFMGYLHSSPSILLGLEINKTLKNGSTYGLGLVNQDMLFHTLLGPTMNFQNEHFGLSYSYLVTNLDKSHPMHGLHNFGLRLIHF